MTWQQKDQTSLNCGVLKTKILPVTIFIQQSKRLFGFAKTAQNGSNKSVLVYDLKMLVLAKETERLRLAKAKEIVRFNERSHESQHAQ